MINYLTISNDKGTFKVVPFGGFPNNCNVVEESRDGREFGRCYLYLTDGICSRHGKVREEYYPSDKRKRVEINGKRIFLHRLIMEKFIGRKLTSEEIVHHKDGNFKNNKIENLEIMTAEEHISLHHAGSKHNYKRK